MLAINRRLVGCIGVLVLCVTAFGRGAGKSDVADAAMKGDKTAMRALLQQKTDVSAPQVDGATALHWAVYRDDAEMADLLIRAGANVKAVNRDGVTPLAAIETRATRRFPFASMAIANPSCPRRRS